MMLSSIKNFIEKRKERKFKEFLNKNKDTSKIFSYINQHKLTKNTEIQKEILHMARNEPYVLCLFCDHCFGQCAIFEEVISNSAWVSAEYAKYVLHGKLPDWWHNKMILAAMSSNPSIKESALTYFKYIQNHHV